MKQYNMTEERVDFTRQDVMDLLATAPVEDRNTYMREQLETLGLSALEVDKIISDLDSYQMLDE